MGSQKVCGKERVVSGRPKAAGKHARISKGTDSTGTDTAGSTPEPVRSTPDNAAADAVVRLLVQRPVPSGPFQPEKPLRRLSAERCGRSADPPPGCKPGPCRRPLKRPIPLPRP